MRLALVLSLAATTLVVGEARAFERPTDDATLPNLAIATHEEIAITELVAMWGRRFDALPMIDQNLHALKVRFVTPVTALTWGATKSILEFHDAVVIEGQPVAGGPWMLRVHHRNTAPNREPGPYPLVDGARAAGSEVVTAVFPIAHGAGQSIFNTIMQIWRRDPNARLGTMFHVPGPELIIIVDQASKVRYFGQLIESLDVAGPRRDYTVVTLEHAPAEQVAALVTQALTTLATQAGPVPGGVTSAAPQVLPDPRTNQLIISANAVDHPLVRRLVSDLDVPVAVTPGKLRIYRCRDVEAEHLASRLQEVLNGAAAAGGAASTTVTGVATVSQVPTRIVADAKKNFLIIQAEEPAYREILRLLAELDEKPRRVMIEGEVWEVSTPTDQLSIGVELAALTNAHEGSTRPAGATGFGLSQLSVQEDAAGNPTSVGRLPGFGAGLTAVITRDTFSRIPLILNMIANFEQAKLVTKPYAVTNDNSEATFTVELTTPFLKNEFNQIAQTQSVDYARASTNLRIKPQVNSETYLTLEVSLQISSFSGSGSASLPPGTSSRSYTGKVTVPSNEYVVFGGLEQETERTAEDKVPFLGDIPILGHLFKNWTRSRSRSRVYIFIRATIFDDEDFADDARAGQHLRRVAHEEAERAEWLPPIVPERLLRGAGYDLQDEAFERFGTGSGDPFRGGVAALTAD
jgi:general secretion pathway protein D